MSVLPTKSERVLCGKDKSIQIQTTRDIYLDPENSNIFSSAARHVYDVVQESRHHCDPRVIKGRMHQYIYLFSQEDCLK